MANPFDASDHYYEAWLSEREARENCARREQAKEKKKGKSDEHTDK